MFTEKPGCRAATIQALRYHFRLRTTLIARLVGASPQIVSSLTVSQGTTALAWWERHYQTEAIEAAAALLNEKLAEMLTPASSSELSSSASEWRVAQSPAAPRE